MKTYILGAGAHGRVVADIFHSQGRVVAGFLDDDPALHGKNIGGIPVLGGADVIRAGPLKDVGLIVAIGKAPLRLRLTQQFKAEGFALVNAFHRSSIVSPAAQLGHGICLCAGAVINPGASIGDAVIVNTAATVDHDCIIEDGAHLSPGVNLAGRVKIGSASFLGTGVSVAPRLRVGHNSIIGAGSVVVRDLPDDVLAYGVPARIIRDLKSEPIDWSKLL